MMSAFVHDGLLGSAGPELVLAALLLAGHLVADFGLQTRSMAEGKDHPPVLLAHGLVVALAHLAALLPILDPVLAGAAVAVALLHVLVDHVKARATTPGRRLLAPFLADQAAHLAILATGWVALLQADVALAPPSSGLRLWAAAWMTLGVFAFACTGGAAVVSGTLELLRPGLEDEEDRGDRETRGLPGSGRLIGILERSLSLLFVVGGQWAAVALLVTAKSVARFEALKERPFAEYYLVGTLTSLLVAVLAGMVLSFFLRGVPFGP